jgi:hypothetical protein
MIAPHARGGFRLRRGRPLTSVIEKLGFITDFKTERRPVYSDHRYYIGKEKLARYSRPGRIEILACTKNYTGGFYRLVGAVGAIRYCCAAVKVLTPECNVPNTKRSSPTLQSCMWDVHTYLVLYLPACLALFLLYYSRYLLYGVGRQGIDGTVHRPGEEQESKVLCSVHYLSWLLG